MSRARQWPPPVQMNHTGHPEGECCRHPERIFVFGSNLSGFHGAGAARHAKEHHGARMYRGRGPDGGSYALPTKGFDLETLPVESIASYVGEFLDYARDQNETTFFVTKVGCGLAGIDEEIMKAMFKGAPANCMLPEGWR